MKKIILLLLCCLTLQSYSQCFTSVSSKVYHNLALKSDGTLWSWGNNGHYELGNNSNVAQPSAIQVGSDSSWSTVSAGTEWSLALKTDGTMWAWGRNDYGQTVNPGAHTPQKIGTDSDWSVIAAGLSFAAAIKSDGTLWMWGANFYGQLGNGTTQHNPVVTQVGTDNDWVSVSVGSQHTMALKSNGTLWAWGRNQDGAVGIGNSIDQYTPVQVGTDNDWVQICAGYSNSYAIKSNGSLWAWGSNTFGQVGNGSTLEQNLPLQIGNSTWKSVSATHHVLAIKTDGTLWSWGRNTNGEVGNANPGVNQFTPVQVGTASDWKTAVAGFHHSIAIKNDGALWSWGDNQYGTLGDGTFTNNLVPTLFQGPCDQPVCTVSPGTLADVSAECPVELSDLTVPLLTDSCGNTVTPTILIGAFPITEQGTTTIVWRYNTTSGQVTAQQDIIINDNTAPVPQVSALADVLAQCGVNLEDLEVPQALDNCSGLITATTNALFPISSQGTTVVTWTYTDSAGNTSTQSQNIIINDSLDPVPDVTALPVLTAQCALTGITPPTATDACSGNITGTTTDPLTYSSQGSYTITWSFDDSHGNVSTQTQNILIDDTTEPQVLAQGLILDLQGQESVSITPEDIDGGSSDNCGELTMALDMDTFTAEGTYTVNLTVSDIAGNTSTASATVTVIDTSLGTEDYNLNNILLYPVPVSGWLTIKAPAEVIIYSVKIYDLAGRMVYISEQITDKVDLSGLSASGYRIVLETSSGRLSRPLVKH